MTDVPDLVRVAVVAPIGNSDHSSLSAVISMAQAVPNLCVSRKVFLRHKVNWNTVCGAIQDLPCYLSRRLGILKSWQEFHYTLLLGISFRCFVLPLLEYCSAVWCSAAKTHLKLLDRVVSGACFLIGGVV